MVLPGNEPMRSRSQRSQLVIDDGAFMMNDVIENWNLFGDTNKLIVYLFLFVLLLLKIRSPLHVWYPVHNFARLSRRH